MSGSGIMGRSETCREKGYYGEEKIPIRRADKGRRTGVGITPKGDMVGGCTRY